MWCIKDTLLASCCVCKATVEYVELTCLFSCGFYVIDVQLWETARQQKWLCSVCKLTCCPDTLLPQCGCKLGIVRVKPAQKGLKLCLTCKASHAQNSAEQIPLVNSTNLVSNGCLVGVYTWHSNDRSLFFNPQDKISITRGALSRNEEQVQRVIYTTHDWLPRCNRS